MDVVSTANGDEFDLAEHGDNLLSTKSSGCSAALSVLMTAADVRTGNSKYAAFVFNIYYKNTSGIPIPPPPHMVLKFLTADT